MSTEQFGTTPPMPTHIMLNYAPLGLVRATTRCVGENGMSVDTGAIALAHDAPVEISYSYRNEDRFVVHRRQAVVSGRSSNGATTLTFRND